MFVEDVGRHNAIDTIAADVAARHGGADKIFYTTGRLTSEMVIKSAQMGVPVIVSRSGITQMGHQLATQLGLALFGRATNRHFICYLRLRALRCAARASQGERLGDSRQVPQHRRPGAPLDFGQQRLVPAEHEQCLGHHEHRADEQADDVVDECRLAPFVPMADETGSSSRRRTPHAPGEPTGHAAVGDLVRQQDQHADAGADRKAEHRGCRGSGTRPRRARRRPCGREGQAAECERRPGEQHADPNTIIGTPTKWLMMLRRSRWYSAYWLSRSTAWRIGLLRKMTALRQCYFQSSRAWYAGKPGIGPGVACSLQSAIFCLGF